MKMKVVGRRLPPGNPFATGEWDGFVELLEAFRLGPKGFVPRGVYKFKIFEEALEWEEKMLLGEVPGPARKGDRG